SNCRLEIEVATGGVTITVSNTPSAFRSYVLRHPCASLPPKDGTGLRVPINCWWYLPYVPRRTFFASSVNTYEKPSRGAISVLDCRWRLRSTSNRRTTSTRRPRVVVSRPAFQLS